MSLNSPRHDFTLSLRNSTTAAVARHQLLLCALRHVYAEVLSQLMQSCASVGREPPFRNFSPASMTILRHFFTEAPYAAALINEYLSERCSSCFEVANDRWTCDCGKVAYCSEVCMTADVRWHEFECIAFRKNPRPTSGTLEVEVRLLGRLFARQQVDGGVTVLSSQSFPSHLMKDRCLGDLMSHERDYAKKPWFEKQTNRMLGVFFTFFKSTALESLKPNVVRRMNCMASINGFSVTYLLKPGLPDTMSYLDEALYLNSSRFNHSCKPSLMLGFHGSHLVVKFVDYENNGGSEQCKTITKKQFKLLTFNYGFGTSWNYGCSFSTREQRVASLQSRYFFRCRCELCRDKLTNVLQLNSSTIECPHCGNPYVWRIRKRTEKATLIKVCRCPLDQAIADKGHWCHETEVRTAVKYMSNLWMVSIEASVKVEDYPSSLIARLEPLRRMCSEFWNRSYNVRLGQLCEKLFEAYWQKLYTMRNQPPASQSHSYLQVDSHASSTVSTTVSTTASTWVVTADFQDVLKTALEIGKIMLASYTRYWEPDNLAMALTFHRMASLYRLVRDGKGIKRSSYYYLAAAEVWKMHDEPGCQKFFEGLSERILTKENVEKKAIAGGVTSGK